MATGIDAGSLYLKVAVLDEDGEPILTSCRRHDGNPMQALREIAAEHALDGGAGVGVTGGRGRELAEQLGVPLLDGLQSTIRGVAASAPRARNIIDAGGSSITLIELDSEGRLQNYSTNSLCAAGTGSFLDAQAARLGLELDDIAAFERVEDPPTIAARCTVFAKSDLIHRQQEGYGKEALWSGLSRGMAGQLLQTLLSGRPLVGPTAVVGGVSRQKEVMHWLEKLQPETVFTFDGAEFACARGAALIGQAQGTAAAVPLDRVADATQAQRAGALRPPLELVRSRFPSFEVEEGWTDEHGTEVRLTRLPEAGVVRGYLGIDVGSTSTKCVLIDFEGRPMLDLYRKTAGDPVGATKHLFTALGDIEASRPIAFEILGCGTTGSGRKLAGAVVGADAVVNEISAHVAGAAATDPDIDTIFEIGGQDSKYIRVRNGVIRDVNMNYVCAAGTGSFVEEQARKLGYGLEEIGPLVMDVAPPHTSDRCTVFMEQDLQALLREGYSPKEGLAAVLYSVVQNYLEKVVGNRQYSRERIFFCGATARNKGLVAAFERLLGAEVVVSPYCHVLGAWGVALLSAEAVAANEGKTTFKGLDLSSREVALTQEVCDLCENYCRITYAQIAGEDDVPSWGYLCGRDPEATEKHDPPEFEPVLERGRALNRAVARRRARVGADAPIIGIPQALGTYSHRALWQTFLGHLGYRVLLSTPTGPDVKDASDELVASEYCFPKKLMHGHVAELAANEQVEWIFLPHLISDAVPKGHTNAYFCPLACAAPAVLRSALRVHERRGADRILSPRVDFRWNTPRQSKELFEVLGDPLNRSESEIRKAWLEGLKAQAAHEVECRKSGKDVLAELRKDGRPIILLLGRPYNLFDGGANLELPLKIAQYGYPVLPMDLAPYHDVELGPEFRNIYWSYGQKLMKALLWVREQPDVFPIWFTNFKCGPDSFLLSYGEHVLADKPFLILELDEHGGDAGYMTRIEAFLDRVRSSRTPEGPFPTLPVKEHAADDIKRRRVWVTHMHPFGTPLAAAAMRGEGYNAVEVPEEDGETLAIGRSVTRGGECLPMAVTIGRLLQTLRKENVGDGRDEAFFLPSACGPCRFGQYTVADRLILEREGMSELAILAPNNDNAYQGLDERLRRRIFTGITIGDVLFKLGCRYRPYEEQPGEVDRLLTRGMDLVKEAFGTNGDLRAAVRAAIDPFHSLPEPGSDRPLVGVVGEIFVRANPFSNDYVVRSIEESGGEAWLSPFHEWVLYAAWEHERRSREGWDILGKAKSYLKNRYLFETEQKWYREAGSLLADRHEPTIQEMADAAAPYASFNFGGEVLVTVGRAIGFKEQGAAMVVNCSPFGCMPGGVVNALLNEVQRDYRIPVLNLMYDGTGDLNRRIAVFLRNLHGKAADVGRSGAVHGIPLPMLSPSSRVEASIHA